MASPSRIGLFVLKVPGSSRPLRALFVNGNLGGHVTMHQNIRRVLAHRNDVDGSFLDVPRAGLLRELLAARIPILNHFDLDLKQFRFQLCVGAWVRWKLRDRVRQQDVLHIYPHDLALLSPDIVHRLPTVVSLDAPNSRGFLLLPYRRPTQWTHRVVRLSMLLEQRVFNAATLIVAQSKWAAHGLEQEYGVDPGKIRVIRFGILPPPIATESGIGAPQITYVGRTMDRKGGWQLLRVFRDDLRDRSLLNLVTEENVAPELGVRVFNHFVPGHQGLLKLLAQTAVFTLPSDAEMSPYAVVEAMAMGIPVVACRVGGVSEMVQHGVTGFLVEPGDDRALSHAIATLIDNKDLRRKMGDAGRVRFARKFDAEATTNALVGVLNEARATFRVDSNSGH